MHTQLDLRTNAETIRALKALAKATGLANASPFANALMKGSIQIVRGESQIGTVSSSSASSRAQARALLEARAGQDVDASKCVAALDSVDRKLHELATVSKRRTLTVPAVQHYPGYTEALSAFSIHSQLQDNTKRLTLKVDYVLGKAFKRTATNGLTTQARLAELAAALTVEITEPDENQAQMQALSELFHQLNDTVRAIHADSKSEGKNTEMLFKRLKVLVSRIYQQTKGEK